MEGGKEAGTEEGAEEEEMEEVPFGSRTRSPRLRSGQAGSIPKLRDWSGVERRRAAEAVEEVEDAETDEEAGMRGGKEAGMDAEDDGGAVVLGSRAALSAGVSRARGCDRWSMRGEIKYLRGFIILS